MKDTTIRSGRQFINLPKELFANLTSLRKLSIIANCPHKLKEDIFEKNFEMLQKLTITKYEGNTLQENIFNNTTNIIELRITNNNLKSLPHNIFDDLKRLEILDLSYNRIEIFHL